VEDPSSATELKKLPPILEKTFRCPVHNGTCPPGNKAEFLVTTINSAELIKHASNSFLALKISYANVIAIFVKRSARTSTKSRMRWVSTPALADNS